MAGMNQWILSIRRFGGSAVSQSDGSLRPDAGKMDGGERGSWERGEGHGMVIGLKMTGIYAQLS
jgi:hypothetical protein